MAFGSKKAKQAQRTQKQEWNQAIAEGRVVRLEMGAMSFPTAERCQAYLVEAAAAGVKAELIDPSLAQV